MLLLNVVWSGWQLELPLLDNQLLLLSSLSLHLLLHGTADERRVTASLTVVTLHHLRRIVLHVVRMAHRLALLEAVRHLAELGTVERAQMANLVDRADVLVMLDVYNL